jgi:hypothetical protein
MGERSRLCLCVDTKSFVLRTRGLGLSGGAQNNHDCERKSGMKWEAAVKLPLLKKLHNEKQISTPQFFVNAIDRMLRSEEGCRTFLK